MTPTRILGFIVLLTGALLVGLLVDWRPDQRQVSDLKIPDNIDYYLAEIRLKSFDEQGALRYRLDSPYLEHFLREDVSKLQQPNIDYLATQNPWNISAMSGTLQHQSELFELSEQVQVTRHDDEQGFKLSASLMIFDPNTESLSIPRPLHMVSRSLDLTAASAQLDIANDRHSFERVKAVYTKRSLTDAG